MKRSRIDVGTREKTTSHSGPSTAQFWEAIGSRALVAFFLLAAPAVGACTGEGAKELREFAQVEAAIGMVASSSTFDRAVRIEQLESIGVSSERVGRLQTLCIAAYKSFNRASALLESARQRTAVVEAEVNTLRAKREAGGELSSDEERRILDMSTAAVKTLRSVTRELDQAEEKVAACEAKRQSLREIMANR